MSARLQSRGASPCFVFHIITLVLKPIESHCLMEFLNITDHYSPSQDSNISHLSP